MTDYLALAMAQWEEVSAIMAEELASTVEGAPGGRPFRLEKPQGEGVSIRPPPGPPPPPTKGGGLRTPSPWNPPQAVLPKERRPGPRTP